MQTVDIILISIIALFGAMGFWFGMVHTLGSLIGPLFGVYVASRYYESFAAWLLHYTGWEGNVPKVVAFIVSFIVINRLIGFAFWIVDKISSVFTHLPFIRSLNHFAGFVLGLMEGILTIGIGLYFISKFPLSNSFMGSVATSRIAPYTIALASFLWPFIPQAIRILKSTVDYVESRVRK